ncbi:acyl-CoA dehydrogenase [Paraburkholderia sp. GAS334]|uniref:acyl-CoA dehydrogenase n=1 Tax=Paraburkholderia sp. GAS334 TaxID=3035131 RepID=UPI003D2127C0
MPNHPNEYSVLDGVLAKLDLPCRSVNALAGASAALTGSGYRLPLPGRGATLARWRVLATIAGRDLSLVKIYESHTDALAILAESRAPMALTPGRIWAVWAAEPPDAVLRAERDCDAVMTLTGAKAWCSGAAFVTDALVTCRGSLGEKWLAAVHLRQPGIHVTERGWHAVGMAATQSVEVEFDAVPATPVGVSGEYLSRPGFWQGAAGIAACWYGAAAALGNSLRRAVVRRDDPYRRAHLGTVDAALTGAASVLRETAAWIDDNPHCNAMTVALRARSVTEAAVCTVLEATGRALGATPFCRDRWFAQMSADLPVFVRQSHAEHDLAALGQSVARDHDEWSL